MDLRPRVRANGGPGRLRRSATILGILVVVALSWSSGCNRGEDSSTAPAGCGSDNDCKGDRICVQGVCTEPPAASPAPAAGAEQTVRPQVKEFRIAVRKLIWYRSRAKIWNEQHPGACPASLGELVGGETATEMHVDSWGRPFVLKCGATAPEGHPIGVMSLGPDGVEGTDDDLRSW
jgi:hypothetical protein